MKLSTIFTQLTHGELSQIHFGGSEVGVVSPNNYVQMYAHVDLALTALHSRFHLKEGRLVLQLQPGTLTYNLHSDYALSNSGSIQPVKYIIDSIGSPFKDDILKVERAIVSEYGEVPMNQDGDIYSVFTPSSSVVRVTQAMIDGIFPEQLELVYRANHRIISNGMVTADPDTIEIDLPYTHLEALLLFIASRVHNPIGVTNEFNAGNNYAAKYEAACRRLEASNLQIDQGSQYSRLSNKGWV